MTIKKLALWSKDEYNYPLAGEFIPFLMATMHNDGKKHPAMIVVLGGAYSILQPSEAEGQAHGFYERGYNTFVLVYTNNVTMDCPVGYQALKDISRAVRFIRHNSEELGIEVDRIYATGYSAGAHLVGSLAVRHGADILADSKYANMSNRLDAAFIHYPLVSQKSLVKAEGGATLGGNAFSVLFGATVSDEDNNFMSLDQNVTKDASPMFIFHGTNDTAVSWKGSHALAEACIDAGVPCELHLFNGAGHGMTSEDGSPEDAQKSLYVCDQLYETVKAMSDEKFAEYAPLLGDLNKDMGYDEFMQTVQTKTIAKIWFKALNVDMEAVLKAMSELSADEFMPPKKNENSLLWKDMAVNWLKML